MKTCEEVSVGYGPQLMDLCTALDDSSLAEDAGVPPTVATRFANRPCSRAGAVGGCRIKESTVWWYAFDEDGGANAALDNLTTTCKMRDGVVVSP
jgi:hypothetical protein